MTHPVLHKYRDLAVAKDQPIVDKLWLCMVAATPQQIERWSAHSERAGRFVMIRHGDIAPGLVLEYVPDLQNDTSVTTLYGEHFIFTTRQHLLDARVEIIDAINAIIRAIPNSATVKDGGRDNKEFLLAELGTAQLLQVLAQFSGQSLV